MERNLHFAAFDDKLGKSRARLDRSTRSKVMHGSAQLIFSAVEDFVDRSIYKERSAFSVQRSAFGGAPGEAARFAFSEVEQPGRFA